MQSASPAQNSSPENPSPAAAEVRPELARDLKGSLREGSAHSFMVGIGETYVPAFIMAIGLGEIMAGLIATLPLLAGALVQLISPTMVALIGSYRRWIVWGATVQALSFLPLVLGAATGYLPPPLAFLTIALYWGSGMAVSPAWHCWIGTLLPAGIRAPFLAKRTRYCQLAALSGFLVGGFVLNHWKTNSTVTWAFAAVFASAACARGLSALWLSRLSEPAPPLKHLTKNVTLPAFVANFAKRDREGGLLIYMLAVQLSVQVAAPFFTPFMLGRLQLSYYEYAALIGASFCAKILFLPWLGKRAASKGAHSLLWFSGIGIAIIPVLWLVDNSFWYLLVLQAITGCFWAGYELATTLLVLDRVPENERIGMLTNYNLFNAFAIAVGSLIGASLLDILGRDVRAYYALFALSTGCRALTLFLLGGISSETKMRIPHFLTLEFRSFLGFINPANSLSKVLNHTRRKSKPKSPPIKKAS